MNNDQTPEQVDLFAARAFDEAGRRVATLDGDPSWLPARYRQRIGELRIKISFSMAERRVYRRRRAISCSEWASRHRVVTSGPLAGSRADLSVTPYLPGILDASFSPSVEEIVLNMAPQTAKSFALDTCLAYAADMAPGNALMVYPDRDTAKENCRDRITPIFRQSPRLAELMSEVSDEATSIRLKLSTMSVYMGWAGSPTSLANRSCRYLLMDEIDKYPATAGSREGDTIAYAEKRTRAFRFSRKIWKASTPTTEAGAIWQAFLAAEVIFEFWVRCPECGHYQVMVAGGRDTVGGIKWCDESRQANAADLIRTGQLAWYECEHCYAGWDDHGRNRATALGQWRARIDVRSLESYLAAHRPRVIAFHVPSWLSFFVSLSEVAEAIILAAGNRALLKDFLNGHAAEPWRPYAGQPRRAEAVMALRDDRQTGVVPSWAAALTLTADVQKEGIWYEVRAWGLDRTSALIKYGYLARGLVADVGIIQAGDFQALENIVRMPYETADRQQFFIRFGLVDSGYRVDEVYEFCRLARILAPSKGQETKKTPLSYSRVDTFPGTGRLIPGGLQLVSIDTTFFKDALANRLQVNPTDPGAWLLHRDTGPEYAEHYTAEVKDEDTGSWTQRGRQANHLFDCGVLQLAALQIMENQGIMAKLKQQAEPRTSAGPAATTPAAGGAGRNLW